LVILGGIGGAVVYFAMKKGLCSCPSCSEKDPKNLGSRIGQDVKLTLDGEEYMESDNKQFRFKNIRGKGVVYNTHNKSNGYATCEVMVDGKSITKNSNVYLQSNGVLVNRSGKYSCYSDTQGKDVTSVFLSDKGTLQLLNNDDEVVWENGDMLQK
jgi:hypothetical protein